MKAIVLSVLVCCVTACAAQPPCDPNTTAQARALYRNLTALKGKGVMLGHQDSLAYGMGWKGDAFNSDVYRVCGKFPAVFGWDLGHIGDANNIDGVPFDRMRQWIQQAHAKGGINTVSWHVRVPGTEQSSWTTERVVEHILPGTDRHDAYKKKLDDVAAFLGSLKDDQGRLIPVVFRPYHEHMGSWFWWGADHCTVDEYKTLLHFTIDYLRQKGLHNLLICYSPNTFPSEAYYLARYPGDDYVDILGFDHYFGRRETGVNNGLQRMIDCLVSMANEKGKLAVFSETGQETLPNAKWWTEFLLPNLKASDASRQLLWVLVWRNGRPDHFYVPYPGHAGVDDFKAFEADPYALFMEDLPEMYE